MEKNVSKIDILDNIITSIKPEEYVKIYLYSSINEENINTHVYPFFEKYLYKHNISTEILIANEKNIKVQFDKIAIDEISAIFLGEDNNDDTEGMLIEDFLVQDINQNKLEDRIKVEMINEKVIVSIKPLNKKHEYACYLVFKEEIINKQFYKRYPEFKFAIKEIGEYKLILYIRDVKKNVMTVDIPLRVEIKKIGNSKIKLG